MRRRSLFFLLLPAAVILGGAVPLPPEPSKPSGELLPVAPAVNAQRGSAAALGGEWLAIGAPLEETDQDGREVENSGAVYVFRLESGLWIQKARLTSDSSTEGGRFGHSVALSGDTLAVGALGEGAVYVFIFTEENEWELQERLPDVGGTPYFGGAVTVYGDALVVGAVDPNDSDGSGTVHIFWRDAASETWAEAQPPLKGAAGERFGHSLSLKAETLVAGAPGADESKGAAYVFELVETGWIRSARLTASDAASGDQLGFAVAVEATGQDVVVGAPTADAPGHSNSGALYAFHREGEWDDAEAVRVPVTGIGAAEQIGYVVAVDRDLIAAGAPFGSTNLSGSIYVFTRDGLSWRVLDTVAAGNAESRDLFGFCAAIQGNRVVAGAVLVDQGGSAAGSTYTFNCTIGAGCSREAEPVASDEGPSDRFGVSIDADGDTLVVGSLRGTFPWSTRGFVYLYRRVGSGWLQEERLASPFPGVLDGFGFAVSLQGNELVVGAPLDSLSASDGPSGSPTLTPSGSTYLFRKSDGRWTWKLRLTAPSPYSGDGFGRSVAIDGTTVVVGAVGSENTAGAAYVFERGQVPGTRLPQHTTSLGGDFGRAVAVSGNTIAVGAPNQRGDKAEATVTLLSRSGTDWVKNEISARIEGFGHAIALDKTALLIGTSGSTGSVYAHEPSALTLPSALVLPQTLSGAGLSYFGNALDIHGDTALVLGKDQLSSNTVVAQIFFKHDEKWVEGQTAHRFARSSLDLSHRPNNPPFAAALSTNFFAVTAPESSVGDRILIFELSSPKEERE